MDPQINYKWSLLLIAIASMSLLGACSDSRQKEVAEKGALVMPFDLERSTHRFDKTDDGGRQQVVSDDDDEKQIGLIRSHLREIASRFAQGDFSSPEKIHGEMMPGLQTLAAHSDRIKIDYSDIANGGQILYSTDDASLTAEIHKWFDAQLSDHGSHAEGMHGKMHEAHHGQ